ncbi:MULTISPECIES: hypothetical protein [unclassified Bacillus (in: firmicutes)]|uniref:hypothetical protein n=1 Tax=unclassified Bacillus (in: firmicutes) TaxID=185979 RepID=UPI001BE6BCA7|nr:MULTISPECIES: hypothetical protein [unclassified Bacillus (in: firmicutes)]MBT2723326.1 hypothetical protein [Bacillus sp. ISL-46]MBT2741030.1 hypothetical protein [Bacillus sp. ISL-77]
MTSKEEVRAVLKELLGQEDYRKGKTFVFPDNVDRSYNIVKGLSISNFLKFILPAICLAAVILLIPPHSLGFMMVKMFFVALVLLVSFIFAVLRPITSRSNITYSNYLKLIFNYNSRQKLFFMKPNKRDEFHG